MKSLACIVLLLAACHPLAKAQSDDTRGLLLHGKVLKMRTDRSIKGYLDLWLDLDLAFYNAGSASVIVMRPWDGPGFWHGGSYVATTPQNVKSHRYLFRNEMWESISRDDGNRRLAQDLDQASPPERLTKILAPGSSWKWQTSVMIRFDENPKWRYPSLPSWDEMKVQPSPLWLRVSFEIWPFNAENFKPNLAAKLQQRWLKYGYLWIGNTAGRTHLARIVSEPIELDWKAVVSSETTTSEGLDTSNQHEQRLARFEKRADELRTLLKIPGLSAVILKDQKVLWSKGFGFADFENRVPATPETLYSIASLTKTFAATLVMQLVEQGKLDLDEPVSHYSTDFKNDSVKVKHLLSHTSDGPTPGDHYQYDGDRFNYLTAVIEKKTGKPFREVMVETFLDPLQMASSVPGQTVVDEADKWAPVLGSDNLKRYVSDLSRLSQPYTLYGDSDIIHVPYPGKSFFGAAAGLLSTVLDLAKFDIAIDRHQFLKKETQEKAWTNFISNGGQRLPHGLGWFVTDYHGIKLIWHYGHWGTGFSAIYLKVPEKNLSLIMLANSEALADHQFQLNREDITNNVFACNFLRLFVSEFDCERNSQMALSKWREERRKQAHVVIQVDPKILEAYVGQYYFEAPVNQTLTVTREGSKLFVDIPLNQKTEMFAESESKFFLKIRRIEMTFIRTEGKVTHMDFLQNGETLRAKKIK
jgi:CubicO group peptidase (beta-lactamase class C family)